MTQEPKIFPYIARLLQGAEVVWKPLGEVCKILRGKRLTKKELSDEGIYPVFHGGLIPLGHYNSYNRKGNQTMVINTGSIGEVVWSGVDFWSSDGTFVVETNDVIEDKFLYYYLKTKEQYLKSQKREGGVPTIDRSVVEKLSIPLPPLSVQQEIVRILDKFTQLEAELEAELDCRKRQYEYYRNNLLFYEGNEVEWKTLDQISENLDSKRQPITSGLRTSGKIPYYGASGIVDYVEDYIFDGDFLLISEDGANLLARNTPIAFSVSGKIWVNNHAHILKFRTYEERRFIEFYLNKTDLTPYISGAAQPKLNKKNLNSIKIPIPPLEEQQRIITILDKFDTLVNSISEGLPKEIALRRKQYEYYREKLLSFPKE